MSKQSLTRFAWLSIAAALLTIALKTLAWWLTGSVGLLSDALESVVNLVSATVALGMLTWAEQPPDEDHTYGHSKAEYFSSGVEGGLIIIAAASIAWTSLPRLVHPEPIAQTWLGLGVAVFASLINLGVARTLLKAGRQRGSITLEADAHHLMTDVWTSAGVVVGVALVTLTGWQRLDPLVALLVAGNIVHQGYSLVRRSILGLMDTALPEETRAQVETVLNRYREQGLEFHAFRSRQAGARGFVSFHVLVPGDWSVRRGHDELEQIETDIRTILPQVSVFTHLEPKEDPASFRDITLDREG